MNYLTFDLGTSKIKASLFNENADMLDFSETDSILYDDHGIYQEPEDYLKSVIKSILNIKKNNPIEFEDVGYLITSGQMGGILGVDSKFHVVFPWTYSIDTRYLQYVYDFESRFANEMRQKSGGPPTIAAKIAWIRKDFPEKYSKISKFMNLMAYVSSKLCNLSAEDAFIDCTCLSMSGVADIVNLKWDEQLCEKTNTEIEKLPKIRLPYKEIGLISKNRFGTKNDIKVFAGCGDQIAGFIGSGLIGNNDIIDVSGTYNLIGYCCNKFIGDSKFNAFHSIYSGIGNIYYQLAVISAGGYTFDWFLKNFKYKPVKKISQYGIPSGIFLAPYLGGRYSPTQPYFKGSILNLDWNHTLHDIYAALLESGGYEINFFLDKLCHLNDLQRNIFTKIKVIGSGAENRIENYIKSNILNLGYLKLKKKAFENLGTFVIAKYKENAGQALNELAKKGIFAVEETTCPDLEVVKKYKNNTAKYKKIITSLEKLYKML
jgi:xylulokinase